MSNTSPELTKDTPPLYFAFSSMMENDEQHRENLWNLEDTLKCARTGHWYGMEHCFHLYAQAESRRLGTRARYMEANEIEIYSCDPTNKQEHKLFQELFELLHVFFSTANERLKQLIASHNQHPTNESHSHACQHRDDMGMCKHMMLWLMRHYGMRKEAEEWENIPLPILRSEPRTTQGNLWETTL